MEMHSFSPIFYMHNTKPRLPDRVLLIVTGGRSINLHSSSRCSVDWSPILKFGLIMIET